MFAFVCVSDLLYRPFIFGVMILVDLPIPHCVLIHVVSSAIQVVSALPDQSLQYSDLSETCSQSHDQFTDKLLVHVLCSAMAYRQQFPFGVNPGASMGRFQQAMAQARAGITKAGQTRVAFPLLRTVNNPNSRSAIPPGNSVGAARRGSGARAYGQ